MRIRRLNKEGKSTTVTANIVDENLKHWRGTIFGSVELSSRKILHMREESSTLIL
jgi:hypothetical protein